MKENLSAPYHRYGLGAMDAFDGYVSYSLFDEKALAPEIVEMKSLEEKWARVQTTRSLDALDRLWVDPPGYFARAS